MPLQRVQVRRKGVKGYINCMPYWLEQPLSDWRGWESLGMLPPISECCRQFRRDELPRRYQSEAKLQAKIDAIRQRLARGETAT